MQAYDSNDPFLLARVTSVPEGTGADVELEALGLNLKDIAKRVIKLMPELPKEAMSLVDNINDTGQLADLITSNLDIPVEEKQDVLETFEHKARTRKVLQFLTRQLEILKVREKINTQVQEEMGRNQREYVLRQQLKAIKEELGELDDAGSDFEEFKTKITEAKMPPDVEKVALKQYDRLKAMQPSSAEYTVTRTYSEWLVEMPWSISTEDKIDIGEARNILNADHYDLREGQKRILEYLAVRKLKADKKGPILCLVGPPVLARPRSASRLPRPSVASSCASRWAVCATRPRFVVTVALLRRLAAGTHRSGHQASGHQQPGVRARRDRQAGTRLPRRPVFGAAGGLGSRAEQHVLRSLLGGAVRSVARDVHRDGEHPRPDPRGAARSFRDPGDPGYTRSES